VSKRLEQLREELEPEELGSEAGTSANMGAIGRPAGGRASNGSSARRRSGGSGGSGGRRGGG
jgi:hypothetical protein